MRAGKVAGVQLVLNNWFIALVLLFTLMGMGTKVVAVFASVLWHELAHAFVAVILGYRVREIELLPFGGVARIENIDEAATISEIMVAVAGPLASLVLAAALHLIAVKMPGWVMVGEYYEKINIMLAMFNLLPALPLDGGRITRALLALRGDYAAATKIVVICGKFISVMLVALSAAEFWQTGTLNLTLIIAAVFLYISARTESAIAAYRNIRLLVKKKAELSARGVMPTNHFTTLAYTQARDIVRLFGPEQYSIVLVVDKNFRLKGSLTETQVWEGITSRGLYAKIEEFL